MIKECSFSFSEGLLQICLLVGPLSCSCMLFLSYSLALLHYSLYLYRFCLYVETPCINCFISVPGNYAVHWLFYSRFVLRTALRAS